jgi:nucleoside-diphosphate-sugar epimerase
MVPAPEHREVFVRYLIAGGAGFIGSNLCATLLSQGHEVVCLDNLATGRMSNIEGLMGDQAFSFVQQDVIEPLPSLPPVDAIVHLASPASPPGYQRLALETMRVNSEGTMRLLELAMASAAQFLYASTSEAYGDPLAHPQVEEYRGNVSTTGPRSMYDEAKRYGEALTSLYYRTRGADARIVRIFNTYGPNSDPEDGRLIPNFITQALRNAPLTIYGDGRQTRSLCYVTDLVDGLLAALHEPAARAQVINLGNPEEHTILEFAEIIRELCGSCSELVFVPAAVGDDPQRRRPNIDKAKALLRWSASVSLREGLQQTIDYFKAELKLGEGAPA